MGIEIVGADRGTLGELVMWVPGKPQTAGSKTAIVKPGQKARVIESGSDESRARKRTWRGDLKDAGDHARGEQWGLSEPTDVALDVLFVFVRSRSSDQLRAGRSSGMVKEWAIGLRPVKRPDALKLARAAEDALTGVLWLDDSQIVSERLEKVFGDDVGLDPRAEGLLMVVRQARGYSGPKVRGMWPVVGTALAYRDLTER
jgi:Holliday junction resolvase RusA-like endonuclease